MKALKIVYDDSKKRRVVIFRSFGFEEQFFSDEPLEMCWIPIGAPPRPNCHSDTPERALIEARGRINWLSETGNENST
jgi:hypothetical protein